jgi:CheY-like chemotaxis protein
MDTESVLIIEDDEILVDALSVGLRARGYGVVAQDSVFGAAARVRQLLPAAILLDVCLPYRSGTALLRELKQDPRTSDVPVVLMSGMTESVPADRRALADVVLSKPFTLDSLLGALSSLNARERVS